ncbi:MAG: heme lyase CcmF/NrfE family subunit [Anaerolineales bacterium]|nr:heme lyase CcmF/NrfE family subunit [Anaerolineales bacterium]
MIAELGIVTTGAAFFIAVATTIVALYSALTKNEVLTRSARNMLIFILPLLTIGCLLLIYAQWTGDYSIAYVSSVSSNTQPESLKITALWGSQAGSLLFYSWMLSLFSVAAVVTNWKKQHELMSWVIVFTSGTLAFFLLLNVFYENPYERTWMNPNGDVSTIESSLLQPEGKVVAFPWKTSLFDRQTGEIQDFTIFTTGADEEPLITNTRYIVRSAVYDGNGLNPLLRHPGMVIHPPMLYLGFTGFVIPFAFGMAALAIGQMGATWIHAVRRWSLIAWMFLSIGLVLGGRWAYDVLGWGGYWGWDPVENSAFLPWLTGTAFLHSVMIQEKRGMLKGWNISMIISTYLLVLLGTVATRTGLLSSVHSFAQSPLAIPMGGFLALSLVGSAGLYLWRGNQGYFKGDHEIEGILSRESMFMLNNWVFFALTIVIFWGTWAEKITDFMRGLGLRESVINLGPEYFETPTAILFLIIYLLMGVAPLVAWRRATANRLGKALRIPTAAAVVTMVVMLVFGVGIGVVLGVGIISFAGYATLLEIYKGTHARHRTHGEPYPVALYRLTQRNRRRYGGYVIHLAIVIMGIGIIGSSLFQDVTQRTLAPGQTLEIGPYTMRYNEVFTAVGVDDRDMIIADITVLRDGKEIENLRPRQDFFANSSPMSIAGVHSTVEADFYALLTFWNGNEVTFRVYYNPLVNFVWWGSFLLVFGTLIAAWPDRDPVFATQQRPALRTAAAGAGD